MVLIFTFFVVCKITVLLIISGILDLIRYRIGIIPALSNNGVVHITKGSFQDYLPAPFHLIASFL